MKNLIHEQYRWSIQFAVWVCLLGPTSAIYADTIAIIADRQSRVAPSTQALSKSDIKQARKEVKQLEKRPQRTLELHAKQGDPFAGLVLAQQLSREAQALAALPVLANSAAEDAARWYSLAAKMGALQSKSLNGMSVRPLRATRTKRR